MSFGELDNRKPSQLLRHMLKLQSEIETIADQEEIFRQLFMQRWSPPFHFAWQRPVSRVFHRILVEKLKMIVLHCTALHCVVLYCIVLCCVVLCCSVLCCTVHFKDGLKASALCFLVSGQPSRKTCHAFQQSLWHLLVVAR